MVKKNQVAYGVRVKLGDRSAITKDRIPKKHKETIEALINSIAEWMLTLRS